MKGFATGQNWESHPEELSPTSDKSVKERPRIRNCLYRKLVFTNPQQCIRQKRVKNCQSLYEQEAFLVPFSGVRKQMLISARSSSQKHTMNLHIEFNTMNEVNKVLSRILPKHSNLRGLHLYFNEEITAKSWAQMGYLISKFAHLSSLTSHYRQKRPEMKERELAKKFRYFSMLAGLTSLNLGLVPNETSSAQFITNSGFLKAAFIPDNSHRTEGIIAKLVSRLKKLKATKYRLVGLDSPTDTGLIVYAKALSELPKLQDVCIKLIDCRRITNYGINTSLDYIQTNPQIKKISIALKIDEESTEVEALPIVHPIWTQKHFQYVSLEIKFLSLVPLEALDAVINSLEKMSCLGQLMLDFQSTTWVAFEKVEKLIFVCAKLPSLTDLTIHFYNCPTLDDVTANNILYALNSCSSLKKIHLQFVACFTKIENSPIEITAPLVHCPNLKDLSMSFINCVVLKETQVNRIVEFLLQCQNLEALNLQVYWCKNFLEDHFDKFAKAISSMKLLQRVALGFEGSDGKVVAGGLCPFERMLGRLYSLKYVEINLSYFPEVVNERMNVLASWIIHLKNLEALKICMKGCKFITDDGIKALCYNLKPLQKLGTLMLSWNSSTVRELSKTIVGQIAHDMPNLYCLELHGVKKNGQTSKVCIRLVA